MIAFRELLATGAIVEPQTADERDLCYQLLLADKVVICLPGERYRLKRDTP